MVFSDAHGAAATPLLGETIGENLDRTIARFGDREALVSVPQGIRFTYRELGEAVDRLARALLESGIRPGDRIALLSENRPEWSIVDLAILSLGAINVPIYTTQALDQIEFILRDSGARAIFISNRRLFRHAKVVLSDRQLEHLIFFDPDVAEDIEHALPLEVLEGKGKGLAV